MSVNPSAHEPEFGTSELLAVWQMVAGRRQSYDAMMWQTPALGMTAQAFLLTLSLAADTSASARILSAALSVLISLMVVQLLAKHRRNEFLDSLALEEIEARLDLVRNAGFHPHAKDRYPQDNIKKADQSGKRVQLGPHRFWAMSSFAIWCYGQYLFALAALAIIVTVLAGHAGILAK